MVLDFYENKPRNEELNVNDLAKKLILLLALITGHRMQTFSMININNIKKSQSQLEIRISDRIKTSKRNAAQPLLTLFLAEELQLRCRKTKFILKGPDGR